MVARAGANLRHTAHTHPAARRCGSLNAHASPPSPPQTSRQADAALCAVGIEKPRRRSAGEPARQRASDNFFVTHRKFVRFFLSNPKQGAFMLGEPYVSLLSGNREFLDRAKRVTSRPVSRGIFQQLMAMLEFSLSRHFCRSSLSQTATGEDGGQNWIRTSEGVSQRIYSPKASVVKLPLLPVCCQ